jgi:GMP synthase-like glutamine amidotransferase
MPAARRLLIVDAGLDPTIYRPVPHWSRHADCPFDSVRPPDGIWPEDLSRYSHVILTGSEASICADDPWILQECELVRNLSARGIPILASCFAHQLVVRALSGRRFVRRSPTPEFGWIGLRSLASPRAATILDGRLPTPCHVYSSHFDEVFPLPEEWELLGTSDLCANAFIRWKKGPIWGVQHHPEIGFEEGDVLFNAMLDRRPEQRAVIMAGYTAEKRDSLITGELVRTLLQV